MDEAKLAEIEARANAAAPGPWAAMPLHRESDYPATNYFTEQREVCGDASDVGPVAVACEADFANAAFIAATRADVPALVAEVRRLTAALDAVTTEHAAALDAARREGAEGMRWEASEAAEQWLREVAEVTEDSPADLADAIRALPLDAPGGGS